MGIIGEQKVVTAMPLTARRVVLPAFTLTKTCNEDASGALQYKNDDFSYFFCPVEKPDNYSHKGNTYSYNLFPVALNDDGVPWAEVSIYLLSKLEGDTSPSMSTYRGIVEDLVAFRRFLDEEKVDYTQFPQRKLFRPTYRYRGFLQQQIRLGEIAATTARRRMGAVIAFYRWLIQDGLLTPEHSPWDERDVYVQLTDSRGFKFTKTVVSTDIAVRVPVQSDPYAGTIDDGGRLRPLSLVEQETLLRTLVRLGNTEMTLIHLVALFCGARIQTVLTLRVRHALLTLPDDLPEVRLPVGPGTGVDTKQNKKQSIHIPRWLYEKLRIYALSDRARLRRQKALGGDSDKQYLFLTSQGSPLYTSKEDQSTFNVALTVRHEKGGQAVRQYLRDYIVPAVREILGPKFHYRFHDLRASFGMNLTDHQLGLVRDGKCSLHHAREFVKTRMGHDSSATTDLYLQYRQNTQLALNAQSAYESHLTHLAELATNGPL